MERTTLKAVTLALTFLLGATSLGFQSIQIQSFKTHSRLSFHVDEGVTPQWKDVPGGFELLLKGIGFADLGAPLGQEEQWAKAVQEKVQDSRVSSLRFEESGTGLKISGKWKFPAGDQAPANATMERFDYRDKNPPRYVVDFWSKPGPTVAQLRTTKRIQAESQALKKAEDQAKKRLQRRLASEQKRQEENDLTRFCKVPLSEKTDVILAFKPEHIPVDFSRWFSPTTADETFNYLEPKGDSADAQYVRLALDLYRQGKPALVIRTLDFFDAEHPSSPFRQEMSFLRANALIKLGLQDEGVRVLQKIVNQTQTSPASLHAAMYLAGSAVRKGLPLAALESFQWLIARYPDHRLAWVFHLGAAEALYSMKQIERAAKEYQWVMEHAPAKREGAEAAFRFGDLYLSRQQYEQALAGYFRGIHYFKDHAKDFPVAYVNRAETLYGLGEYERATEAFKKFLEDFPAHPSGWRATYRLGEIHDRKPGAEAQKEARKWYLDTINRHPFSPGATLARQRLIPCGNHAGFTFEAAERFFETEAKNLAADQDIVMDHYAEYRALAYVRTLVAFAQEAKAVDQLALEISNAKLPQTKQSMTELLGTLFRRTIVSMLEQGRRFEALSFYQEKAKAVNGFAQADYLLKLSQAAADLGLAALAEKILAEFDQARKKYAQASAVAHAAPADDVETQLTSSEEAFTRAKVLFVVSGKGEETRIRDYLRKVIDESPHSFEKELILGLLDEKAELYSSALKHAMKAQLLRPAGTLADSAAGSEDEERLRYWIASLQARGGNPEVAAAGFRELSQTAKSGAERKPASEAKANRGLAAILGVPGVPQSAALAMQEGEILATQGKWGDAARAFSRAIPEGGNQALFEYVRALKKSPKEADRKLARQKLEELAGSTTDDFWKKLAREALINEKAKEGKYE